MKAFLVNYQHGGDQYAIKIHATDAEDAKARLGSLLYGRVQGEVVAELPYLAGPLVRLFCTFRNAFAR